MISESASKLSSSELAEVLNECFVGHLGGAVNFTGAKMKMWNEANYVDLSRSYIFYDQIEGSEGRQTIALCLFSRRQDKPNQVRVAAFGVVPQARGKGTAAKAFQYAIESEKTHGTTLVELECLQINVAAVKLYARFGFKQMRELTGWERDATAQPPESDPDSDRQLMECRIEEVDKFVRQEGNIDLPWQAWHFSRLEGADRAFRLGNAWCVISDPDKEAGLDVKKDAIKMMSVFVEPEKRGNGQATRLINAMVRRFPGRAWTSRPIFPREYGSELAAKTGFRETEEKQFLKRLELIN